MSTADSGEFLFEGKQTSIHMPQDATALGIATVYQDLALADNLDVAGNLFLGRERFLPGSCGRSGCWTTSIWRSTRAS